jgi:predicted DsbA family dithiol-disulfide isomerase
MGGLVRDIREFYDPLNEIGGEHWYRQVAAHWEEASKRHGMPVDSSVFYEIKDSFTSTYPANIAFKAAELQNRELAKKYLRRLREGAAAERLHIHLLEVQAQLAREVGLDADRLLEDVRSGRAESEFLKDLKECRSMGITGFPTFLVKNLRNGRSVLVYGYRRYHYFEGLLEELAGDLLRGREVPRDAETVLDFLEMWRKVTTQEVATLLDVDKNRALDILRRLQDEGRIIGKRAGNDYFWTLARKAKALCDDDGGICYTI